MDWTAETIELLNNLWKDGFTARQIAGRLGNGVTRNAVIGKAHRLGLSQRPVQGRKREVTYDPPSFGMVKTCQWPFGHPNQEGFHFCGDQVKLGRPYCPTHCGIAYRRADEDYDGKQAAQPNQTQATSPAESPVS